MMTDTQLLDWIETMGHRGIALISDDNGHWAVSGSGMQNVPMSDEPCDIETSFQIDAKDWKPTAREAIEAYIVEYDEDYQIDKNGEPDA